MSPLSAPSAPFICPYPKVFPNTLLYIRVLLRVASLSSSVPPVPEQDDTRYHSLISCLWNTFCTSGIQSTRFLQKNSPFGGIFSGSSSVPHMT